MLVVDARVALPEVHTADDESRHPEGDTVDGHPDQEVLHRRIVAGVTGRRKWAWWRRRRCGGGGGRRGACAGP